MHAFDERVLGDDEPVPQLGRVVLDPAREPAPLELGQQADLAELTRAASTAALTARASVAARITATPAAPARMQSPAFEASIPPIATTGIVTARQISASPSSPIGGSASGFEGVAQTGPAPM